jgi:hypothetical protein
MNETFDEFESELSRLRPARLPTSAAERIAAELDGPARVSLGDRVLMMFMGSGALAAAVIVGLLMVQTREHSTPSPSWSATPQAALVEPSSIAEYQQALARSNSAGLELLR